MVFHKLEGSSHGVAGEDKCSYLNRIAVDQNWVVAPVGKGSKEVAGVGLTVSADNAGLTHLSARVDGDEDACEPLGRSIARGGRLALRDGPSWDDRANFRACGCAVALLEAVRWQRRTGGQENSCQCEAEK